MLVEFRVKNFMSFRDEAVLSMVASRDKQLEETHVVTMNVPKPLRVLRSAVLMGPNASGKSNLLKAIAALVDAVLAADLVADQGRRLPLVPFKFSDSGPSNPTEFELTLALEPELYKYRLRAVPDRILFEELEVSRGARPSVIFSRTSVPGAPDSVHWARAETTVGNQAVKLMNATSPLLLGASFMGVKGAKRVIEWFKKCKAIHPSPHQGGELSFTVSWAKREKSALEVLGKWLVLSDTGLDGVELHERKGDPLNALRPGSIRESLELPVVRSEEVDGGAAMVVPVLLHRGEAGAGPYPLDPLEESSGTIKFLALAGPLIWALKKGGCILADELDARLHPHLRRAILALFHNPAVNVTGAQILFSSHDVTLLDAVPEPAKSAGDRKEDSPRQIRRDQVWFTRKEDDGATSLYSLWEYKPRKRESLRRAYLMGLYGAVPFLEPLEEATASRLGLTQEANHESK